MYVRSLLWRATSVTMAAALCTVLPLIPTPEASAEALVSQTYDYTGATQTLTVPAGVTSIGVVLTGGQGGRGGNDSNGPSPAGGYVGRVQGTIAVTPGDVLTIAVGSGGQTGASSTHASGGGAAGNNPLAGYDGGIGGNAGSGGASGAGGGGGAATVLQVAGHDIVAAGSGGSGGSGQYAPIVGRLAEDHFVARSDTPSTTGRAGLSADAACSGFCDGGGSGAGGGGSQGGEQGTVQYGGATATEWFGFGGFPGSNSDGSLSGLVTNYQYVTTNQGDGSIVLSYALGVPDPPRSVVGAGDVGSIHVAWLAPVSHGDTPITDYIVKYSTNSAGPFTAFDEGVSTDPSATITGLSNGTPYYLQVIAVNSVGESFPSDAMTFPITPTATPGAMPILQHAIGGDQTVSLEWSELSAPSATLTDYAVEYATNPSGPWTTFVHTPNTDPHAVVTGLTNGTHYLLRVAAVTTGGQDPYSNLAEATPYGAPTKPTITTITPSSSALTVAFTAPANNGGSTITGYQYQLDGGSWANASQTSSPVIIGGLTNGQSYSVALRAINAYASGIASDPATGTPYGVPGAVPGFIATPGATSVTLSWDAATSNGTPVTAYNVIRWSAATAGSISSSQSVSGSTRTATFTGLSVGPTYFTIEATNVAGTGPRTPTRVTALVNGTPPAAPTITSMVIDQTAASIDWASGAAGSSPIGGYIIRYITDDDTRTTLVQSASAASDADTSVPSATATYRIEIAETSAAGTGPFTTLRPPIAVTGSSSVTISSITASLTGMGNANGQPTTFAFQVATAPGDLGTTSGLVVAATPPTDSSSSPIALSASASDLEAATTYYYRTIAESGSLTALGAVSSFTTQSLVTTTASSKVYDGQPVVVSSITQPSGLTVEHSFVGVSGTTYGPTSAAPSEAGHYSVLTTITTSGNPGSDSVLVTISPAAQALTISGVDTQGTAGDTIVPVITSSAGLTATLSIVSGDGVVCTLVGASLHLVAAGTCEVRATQAGSRNYSATTADVMVQVLAAEQVVTPPVNDDATPEPAITSTPDSGAQLPGSLAFTGGAVWWLLYLGAGLVVTGAATLRMRRNSSPMPPATRSSR